MNNTTTPTNSERIGAWLDESIAAFKSALPKGFVQWANEAKDAFYWTNGKDVFRSPLSKSVDVTTGYTLGRWESTVEHWNRYAAAFNRIAIKLEAV